MKRKNVMGIFIFPAVFLMLPMPGRCEDIKGRWGVGYRYGYVVPDDADYKSHANSNNVNVTYGFTDNWALEGEVGYFRLKSFAGTNVEVYSFHTGVQLRVPIKNLTPYFVAGVGFQHFAFRRVGMDDLQDDKFSFSYKSGGGIEYFINKHWALNAEAVYIYGNTGGKATLDVYSWRYAGGIKYYF